MADSAGHDNANVLEVPVTIQGAKHVEGSEQRQIFTETTKTTIVFDNGAVVNLSSKVAQGQCVFLRNERTGREILCKVLEWREVAESGYADLEFTTRDPNFWDAPVMQQPAAAAPVVARLLLRRNQPRRKKRCSGFLTRLRMPRRLQLRRAAHHRVRRLLLFRRKPQRLRNRLLRNAPRN